MSTESVFAELVKIQSWPAVGLVFTMIIVVGYCLRFWETFPNRAIPTVLVVFGAGVMMLISDGRPENISKLAWNVKLACTGSIVAFIALILHKTIISKFEDFLARKFAFLDNALGNRTQTRTEAIENPKPKPDPKI